MIRRLVYGVNMILLYSSPYIQVVVNSSFSFAICYFIFIFKPYKTKLHNIMNLYIETINFLILSIIGTFIHKGLSSNLYSSAEWSVIILIYASITGPALVNIIISMKDFAFWLRERNRKVPIIHCHTGVTLDKQ